MNVSGLLMQKSSAPSVAESGDGKRGQVIRPIKIESRVIQAAQISLILS
jgi:hypothetical protein